jgi:hypothetical protein
VEAPIVANTPVKMRTVRTVYLTVPATAVLMVRQAIVAVQHINQNRLAIRAVRLAIRVAHLAIRAVRRQARNIPILMMCRITMIRKIFIMTITMILMDMRMRKIIGTIIMNKLQ